MSYKIIEKSIAELSKGEPDLSYVRGMLETVLEFMDKPAEDKAPAGAPLLTALQQKPATAAIHLDNSEGALLDGIAKANLDNIKHLAEKSTG